MVIHFVYFDILA